jgi:hypothetical protein
MSEPLDDGMISGQLPLYTQPSVSIRATWSATDGSRPEEVIIEWREEVATRAVIAVTLALVRNGADVSETRPAGLIREANRAQAALDPECALRGEGHDGEGHWCVLPKRHDPAEPGGREHRCLCGGLFAATGEIPDVPGRRGGRGPKA